MSLRTSMLSVSATRLVAPLAIALAFAAPQANAQRIRTTFPDTVSLNPTAKAAASRPAVPAKAQKAIRRAAAPAQRDAVLRRNEVRTDDGHLLVLWEKHPVAKAKGEIVLVHGRTWSALPNFDLQVPGQRVSLMNALVSEGYTVYGLDQRGYGATHRDASGWLTPNRAADDVAAVTDWVAAHAPSFRRPTVLGYSRGSATAMLAAQKYPKRFAGLIMYGPYYNVVDRPAAVVDSAVPPRARTTEAGAAEDFISPDSTPEGVKAAYIKSATTSDPVRVDWRLETQFDVLDPAALRVPVLLIQGENDPYAKDAALPTFFAKLGTADKWWVVLAGTDHVAHLERQATFVRALASFLDRR